MAILQRQKLPFKDRWAAFQIRQPARTWAEWRRAVVYLVRG